MSSDRGTLRAAARAALDGKTKPRGSLGRLEEVAERLAVLQGTLAPSVERARIIVFAADHGVADEQVSAYPAEVTAQMVRNYAEGGAAINVLARSAGLELEVVDVGVRAPVPGLAGIVAARVRAGTRNLLHEPAMTPDECLAALEVGRAAVRRAAAQGAEAVGLGEMGIGNTTAAAAVLCALTGAPAERTVGRGTGIDDARLARKREVVSQAVQGLDGVARGDAAAVLAHLGGLELAAIAGAALEAASRRIAVVADGFISTVAVLVALRLDVGVRDALFVAHRSAESGHALALDTIGEAPLLDLGLRLGEGTGAALALPLLRAAARILREMATFEGARVSGAEVANA